MLSLFDKHYNREEALDAGRQIANSGLVDYAGDEHFLIEIIPSIEQRRQLSARQLKYYKDILFKYDPSIIELDRFLRIDVEHDDIEWAQDQIRRFEATGVYRYRGVDAYKGVAGERVISRYLMNLFPGIQLNRPIGEGEAVDEFDFRLGNITCDIKCSTQLHYASVTPKAPVENAVPKDYYIGARFDDRDPQNNCVYVIGFLAHSEILRYPIRKKYGAPYYEISLLDMHNFGDLIIYFRNHS